MELGKYEAAWLRLTTAEKLKFLAIVNFDFDHAERAINLAKRRAASPTVNNPMKDERYICYSEAAVVRYSRPFFETNVGSEKLRLRESYLNELSPSERESHNAVLSLRRRVSAHSDNAFKGVSIVRVRVGNIVGWDTEVGYQFFGPAELDVVRVIMHKIRFKVRVDLDAFANQLYPDTPLSSTYDLP